MTAAAVESVASHRRDATGRRGVRLKPVEYVQLYGPPIQRCSGCHHRKPDEHLAGGRLDRKVLEELAEVAAWGRDGRAWGDESRPSVPGIAQRIEYSDRSVQYALRRLERGGYVERVERPGFTAWYRICRPVEPVDEYADVVRFPVHNRRASRRRNTGPLHHPGATVAPELGTEQDPTTPVVPSAAAFEGVGAGAPAQAAPQWRGGPPQPPPDTGPPPPARLGSKAHRSDAWPGPVLGLAQVPPGVFADDAVRGVGALAPPGEGDSTSYRLSRVKARRRHCQDCGAKPGEACRRRDGGLRRSVHEVRREPWTLRGVEFPGGMRLYDDGPAF